MSRRDPHRLWFYLENGQSIGPLSEADMAKLIDAGKILPTTLVKHGVGMTDWVPLVQVEG